MAFIERRENGRWRARYRGPDRRERSRTFDRRVDAERFLAGVRADLLRGEWVDPRDSRTTVAQWCEVWLRSKADLRPSSRGRMEATLQHQVLLRWGAVPLKAVSNGEVRAWVAEMTAAGLSPSTVRKAYNALHQALLAAVADRRLAHDPAANVPLPVEEHAEQRFLTAAEVDQLADAIAGRYRALALVACYGGLRFGELAALRRARIDLLRSRVTVAETLVDLGRELSFGPPKTRGSRRTVPLPRSVAGVLDEHLAAHVVGGAGALVFTTPAGGPLRRGVFRRDVWQPAVRAAGLDPLRFHDLRHTFVSLWVDAGADPKEVSVRAGHSTVAFTLDRYGHLYGDREEDLAERLDALLEGARRRRSESVVRPVRGLASSAGGDGQ